MMDPKSLPLNRALFRRPLVLGGFLALGGLAVIALCNLGKLQQIFSPVRGKSPQPVSATRGKELKNPDESFDTLRQVVDRDGDDRTREAAIAWLDRCSRESGVTAAAQESFLLAMLEKGGNSSWNQGYRQHLFNSTFNALRRGDVGEPFYRILREMAAGDPDRTLRLYALQHIGLERGAGRLTGPLSDEIHATLSDLAAEPDGEVSGLAVALLTAWNGKDGPGAADAEAIETALSMAADPTRSLDVRVTAIHAAGAASLPLARKIGVDGSEAVFVRKAAIARIGVHGGAADLALLEKLRGENSRLGQAAEPALKAIRDRIDHPSAPAPIPL